MTEKNYVDANRLLLDSFTLARRIYESHYFPNLLIGIWRGGTPPGIAIHEFLTFKGLSLAHTVIKVHAYKGIECPGEVHIDGLEHALSLIHEECRILIVDDIFDTGRTLSSVIQAIQHRASEKRPEIKVATIFFKPSKNQTTIVPDFYLREVDQWVVFPHELKGLTEEEIRQKGEALYQIIFG
ncbi:MAG: phosphoribosyltransferase family protein [bacterium]